MDSRNERNIDDKTVAAMQACVVHARALLDSARAVRASGHPNIAYHLATLALEEIGRRRLIAVQSLASGRPDPPAWPGKHTQDHIKKLFWCFFSTALSEEPVSARALEHLSGTATMIHENRLAGLYVEHGDDGLGVPDLAISPEQCDALFNLAQVHVEIAESEKLRENLPPEEIELQTWFLKTTEDVEKRRMIFSAHSLGKLAELKDARAWAQWIRAEFENADAV